MSGFGQYIKHLLLLYLAIIFSYNLVTSDAFTFNLVK